MTARTYPSRQARACDFVAPGYATGFANSRRPPALSPAGLICGGAFGWLRRAVLVIVNFSYRGDGELDRADLARLGGTAGFRVLRNGSRAFALWNGLAFHLVRAR